MSVLTRAQVRSIRAQDPVAVAQDDLAQALEGQRWEHIYLL